MSDLLTTIITRYDQALLSLPEAWRGPISFLLLLALAGAIWHVLRRSGLWLVLLIVLVPALIPALRGVGQGILFLFQALFERSNL